MKLSGRKKIISITTFSLFLILILLISFLLFSDEFKSSNDKLSFGCQNNEVIRKVIFNNGFTIVTVEIADTPEERRIGLMGQEMLEYFNGLLFLYDSDSRGGFWMKNTLIPLDMIFISKDLRIVDINRSAQPCPKEGDCPTYTPDDVYRYVLEVNSGFTKENDIGVGDSVEFVRAVTDCPLD